MSTLNVKIDAICETNNSKYEMFHAFCEPNVFTFRVICSYMVLVFTFNINISSHLAAF